MRIVVEKTSSESIIDALQKMANHHDLDVIIKAKEPEVKQFAIPAANKMFNYWDEKFSQMIEDIKRDISDVLEGKSK